MNLEKPTDKTWWARPSARSLLASCLWFYDNWAPDDWAPDDWAPDNWAPDDWALNTGPIDNWAPKIKNIYIPVCCTRRITKSKIDIWGH